MKIKRPRPIEQFKESRETARQNRDVRAEAVSKLHIGYLDVLRQKSTKHKIGAGVTAAIFLVGGGVLLKKGMPGVEDGVNGYQDAYAASRRVACIPGEGVGCIKDNPSDTVITTTVGESAASTEVTTTTLLGGIACAHPQTLDIVAGDTVFGDVKAYAKSIGLDPTQQQIDATYKDFNVMNPEYPDASHVPVGSSYDVCLDPILG